MMKKWSELESLIQAEYDKFGHELRTRLDTKGSISFAELKEMEGRCKEKLRNITNIPDNPNEPTV